MKFFVTGATGFVGKALVARLQREGHQVCAMSRDVETARNALGAETEVVAAGSSDEVLCAVLSSCDVVVNLAGEPIAQRWSSRVKQRIRDSRVELTERLVRLMSATPDRPNALVNASAVGFYGDRGDSFLDEDEVVGRGFLAEVCESWEAAARRAEALGVRTVRLRIGIVLGPEGGVIGKLAPAAMFGVVPRLGRPNDWVPWIHLDDLLELIVASAKDDTMNGAYNAVAPSPARWSELALNLRTATGAVACFPVPPSLLSLALGQASESILTSQRVISARLSGAGFELEHQDLGSALSSCVSPVAHVRLNRVREDRPDDVAGADYELVQTTLVDAPIDEVFAFFSKAENLGLLTPPWTSFGIREKPEEISVGSRIDYEISIGPVPMRWRTSIEVWSPGERFVDNQERGPYALWWHEHRFEARGPRTLMHDRVLYRLPLGPLGRIAHPFLVAPALRRIFGYRSHLVRLRFGASDGSSSRPPVRDSSAQLPVPTGRAARFCRRWRRPSPQT